MSVGGAEKQNCALQRTYLTSPTISFAPPFFSYGALDRLSATV
jgi:hypothetical protein